MSMEQKKLAIVYGPALLDYDFGPEHPFSAKRSVLTFELMKACKLIEQPEVGVVPTYEADDDDLYLFHSREHVNFVRNACIRGYGYLDGGDTPAVQGGFEAAKTVVGSSWRVTEMVAKGETRYGVTLLGGLHHAHPSRVSGFCVFNDLAICILKLRQDFGFKRVAYIDFDAHHGDGVVFGFYEDKDVLTIDYHEDGRYLFPGTGGMEEVGRGQGLNTKFNIPLPPYSSDHSFIYAFDELVPPLLRKFQPEFILLQMGVDAHGGDPLSDMNFSANSYLHATRQIRNLADELCEGRLVMFGGGGYNLETCALRWTEMSASLIDFKMPDFVPQDWREFYQRQTKQEAAVTFIEDFTKDNTFERVVKIVNYLKMRGGLE